MVIDWKATGSYLSVLWKITMRTIEPTNLNLKEWFTMSKNSLKKHYNIREQTQQINNYIVIYIRIVWLLPEEQSRASTCCDSADVKLWRLQGDASDSCFKHMFILSSVSAHICRGACTNKSIISNVKLLKCYGFLKLVLHLLHRMLSMNKYIRKM